VLTRKLAAKENFFKVKHIFLPIGITRPGGAKHVFVVVISPSARTVDYLDSGIPKPEKNVMSHSFNLLSRYLEQDFDSKN
jgi:hypothetical protein